MSLTNSFSTKKKFSKRLESSESLSDLNKGNQKITIVPFKKKYLKIYKGDNKYYILDRYKYDINAIMMLLDLNKINNLHEFYKAHSNGIEKTLFINHLKNEIPISLNDPMDETNLVYGLYKFFCEIDFNGDNHMQWEEFTQFIINTVEGDNEAKVDENEDENNNKKYNEKKMLKFKRYHISKLIKDNLIHKKDVISAVFIPRIDIVLVNEYSTKIIKMYNPKTGRFIKDIDLETFLNPKNFIDNLNKKKNFKEQKFISLKSKKNENKLKHIIYSVLYIYQYQNIIVILLSDKRIIFFNFASEDRIELIHEMQMPILEKRIWYLQEHNLWVTSGCKLENYNYYTLNELDIEFKYYNQKYECLYNENHIYNKHYCDIIPHKGEILDCIELHKPMLIITGCMDGKIRLINLNDKNIIKIWNNHSLGVRCLDYNPYIENYGIILSVGFEYFINIYCTDLSIEEAYKGKLEGHNSPVISCKFLSNSYMAVSVDEEANVRIWNVKLKVCLELITSNKKNFKVINLLCLAKYNKFLIYGNKIIYYDANFKEEEKNQKIQNNDDNYPIKVEFNNYYQQFFITTFKDVRIYNKNGNIFKIFKKLNDNEHFDNDIKIKNFLFEDNHRKFYIGYSNGAIMQFNAGNGSLVKTVNEKEIEKDGISNFIYSHSKEITSLYFFHDKTKENKELLLISTSYDSLINIYKETNSEETEILKIIRGGHTYQGKKSEINCMDFSVTECLFATGSSNGLIVLWDFEMSKINDTFLLNLNDEDKLSVLCLKFLDPFPILASSYNNGNIYFWNIKKNINEKNDCLVRVRNYNKHFHKIELSNVKCMNIYYGFLPDIKCDIPLKKYFDENSPFMNSDKKYETLKKYTKKTLKKYDLENLNNMKNNNEGKNNNHEMEEDLDIVPNIYKNEIIDKEIDPELYLTKKEKNIINSTSLKYYLIFGDINGNIKLIDMLSLIKKYKIDASSQIIIRSSFNLLKKEDINVETILNHNISAKKNYKYPKFLNLYYNMIRSEFKAHNEDITCISIIKEPLSFITSSKDKFVKIFNFSSECLGIINVLPKLTKIDCPNIPWNFKVNEEKILENEITEVVNIFEKVGIEPIKVGSNIDIELENINEFQNENLEEKKIKNDDSKMLRWKFKKLEKNDKNIKKNNNTDEINMTYESYYLKNVQKSIEELLNVNVSHTGFNEIADTIIKSIVDNDKENKKLEKKRDINNFPKRATSHKKVNSLPKEKQKISKKLSLQVPENYKTRISPNITPISTINNSPNIIKTQIDENKLFASRNKNILSKKITKSFRKPTKIINKNKQLIKILTEKDTNEKPLILITRNNSNFNKIEKISNQNNIQLSDSITENFSPLKNNLFLNYKNGIISNNKNNKSKNKANSFNIKHTKKSKSKFRQTFYVEKLFNKNISITKTNNFFKENENEKKTNETKIKKKLRQFSLPCVNDKVIFKKGETEKLLNYQFYNASYKACCEINKQSDMSNSSMKTNYNNNWKYVTSFANEHRDNKFI